MNSPFFSIKKYYFSTITVKFTNIVLKIIFIDDQEKYLKEVEKFCAERGLDFVGIHYTESLLAPIPEFDSDKEKMRFNILEEEHVWLSDSELEQRL